MAELLVAADLRCVFSHGTKQIPGYIQKIQQGQVNPRPNIKVVTESPTAFGTRMATAAWGICHVIMARRKLLPRPRSMVLLQSPHTITSILVLLTTTFAWP